MQLIDLQPSVPNQRLTTQLDGQSFILDVVWNERAAGWYMTVRDEDENPLIQSARLVLGAIVGDKVATVGRPAGHFFVRDTTKNHAEAGLDDLGTRVQLWFVAYDEAQTLG